MLLIKGEWCIFILGSKGQKSRSDIDCHCPMRQSISVNTVEISQKCIDCKNSMCVKKDSFDSTTTKFAQKSVN